MKNDTIGNQQGSNIYDIGYLIGMLDGEGTVSLSRSGKTNVAPLYCKLQPYISICGTDHEIMDRVIQSCKNLNLPFYVRESKRVSKNKPAIIVQAYGLNRVLKWIECFKDYDFGKKHRLDLIEKFISIRLEKISKQPVNKPYGEEEIRIYNAIRIVNERGGKSRYLFTPKNPNESPLKEKEWKYDKMIELVNKGWSQQKIAKFFSIDQSSVSKWIKRNIKPSTTTIKTEKSEGIV